MSIKQSGLVQHILFLISLPFRLLPPSGLKERIRAFLILHSGPFWKIFLIDPGETVMQVGTPNRATLAYYSRIAGARGRVYVVEADRDNCAHLEDGLGSMPHRNITLIHKGVWSEKGRLRLLKHHHAGGHKVAVDGVALDRDSRSGNAYGDSIEIDVDTIDNIIREYNIEGLSFISITVNGAELEALKGCTELLKRGGLRLYTAGYTKTATGEPLNRHLMRFLDTKGFRNFKTRPSTHAGKNPDLTVRDGNVYSFKA